MSSLIFHTDPEQVMVATDTLATSINGTPFMFTTKAFILPHLRMIIAGTGAGGFLGKWFIQINDRVLVEGIDNLDQHTSRCLVQLWQDYKVEFNTPDSLTTTVYHFGFSEKSGLIHTYVYRSFNNFRSEQIMQYGIGIKPECTVPENYELPKDIKTMMLEQRVIQSSLPKENKVHIGGEIQIHHLVKHGFSVYTLDKFEDYDEDKDVMYENFHSNQQIRLD